MSLADAAREIDLAIQRLERETNTQYGVLDEAVVRLRGALASEAERVKVRG